MLLDRHRYKTQKILPRPGGLQPKAVKALQTSSNELTIELPFIKPLTNLLTGIRQEN